MTNIIKDNEQSVCCELGESNSIYLKVEDKNFSINLNLTTILSKYLESIKEKVLDNKIKQEELIQCAVCLRETNLLLGDIVQKISEIQNLIEDKNSKYVTPIDLGDDVLIPIPPEILKNSNIKPNDVVDVVIENGQIKLTKKKFVKSTF